MIAFIAWPVMPGAQTQDPSSTSNPSPPAAAGSVDSAPDAASEIVQDEGTPAAQADSSAGVAGGSGSQAAPKSTSPLPPSNWLAMSGANFNPFHPMNMMNPAVYMNMMHPMAGMASPMLNYPVDVMTQMQFMDMMMRSMDPHMMFGMFGQVSPAYREGQVPEHLPVVAIPGFPTQSYRPWPVNKVSPGVSREAKKNAFQTAMAVSPLSMRDMISIMADKIPVDESVSWDDAVEAMKLRANEINFKFVGSSPLWKEIEAVTGQPSARVEMFRFCDAATARKILDVVPEFVIFLPCMIALIEDGEGKLWVMTLDWDVGWLDFSQNRNSHLSKDLREDAVRIREAIAFIMEGAATGEF